MPALWPIPADLNVVTIDGYPLSYAEQGTGAPLVLVHGSIVDYRTWSGVMVDFARDYRVIAPNLRHYFPEPWRGEGGRFSCEQHADDLAALLGALGIGQAHFLGWSRGGTVVVEVAKRHPRIIRSMILEDGGIDMPVAETEQTREATAFTRTAQSQLRENSRAGDLVHAAQTFGDTRNGQGWWLGLPEWARQMILQNIQTALGDARRPVTSHAEVAQFDFPTLLLHGATSPKRYEFFYNEMRKCRAFPPTVVIPDAGHAMHTDNKPRFVTEVRNFLAPL